MNTFLAIFVCTSMMSSIGQIHRSVNNVSTILNFLKTKIFFNQVEKAKNQSAWIIISYFHTEKFNRKHTRLEQQDQGWIFASSTYKTLSNYSALLGLLVIRQDWHWGGNTVVLGIKLVESTYHKCKQEQTRRGPMNIEMGRIGTQIWI